MEKQDLASALLKKQIQKEAWENISRNYPLTERMLMQHSSDLNWEEVSQNSSIHWDVGMLERFRGRIDWQVFSRNADEDILSEEMIEKFKDNWDWAELSRNHNLPLTYGLIDKYTDRWDWDKLTNNYLHNGRRVFLGMDFFERYQQYIPIIIFYTKQRNIKEIQKVCKSEYYNGLRTVFYIRLCVVDSIIFVTRLSLVLEKWYFCTR